MTLLFAAALGLVVWWYLSPTETVNGAVRFKAEARARILTALASTVPLPVIQPAFDGASTFQATRFDPASVSTSTLIEGARQAGFPVAVSEHVLEAIASPDARDVFVITMKRGRETVIAAPGSGFALIVD